jgi:aminoglycoside phosphotransferase (APT) family kinase protein
MHPDEQPTSVDLVRRLVAAQFPAWAGLPVVPVTSSATIHALYRLGDGLVARLPRLDHSDRQARLDRDWLPRLAPYLPLAVPEQVALGAPGEGYPFTWSVCRWLAGGEPGPDLDQDHAARSLGAFVSALSGIRGSDGPPADGSMPAERGVHVRVQDDDVRSHLAELGDRVDGQRLTAAWEGALAAPAYDGTPVWVHGDLLPGNLLARDGRLTAVIDFGAFGSGDPAIDLVPAWTLLDAPARAVFREAVGCDAATWTRGRGWALSIGVGGYSYYRRTNPAFAAMAHRTIGRVLEDHAVAP